MRYVLAISGGIDSVVLLHLFATRYRYDVVVAHFDHGIRPESDADARFVEGLAHQYGVLFVMHREELGAAASEEAARDRRYNFLFNTAEKYNATLVTAHHRDDIIETIAINIARGTGWRGLAVMDNDRIKRPLIGYSKHDIRQYALAHQLEWVEDETNSSTEYLRNTIRFRINAVLDEADKMKVMKVWANQRSLKRVIDQEAAELNPSNGLYARYPYIMHEPAVAGELLRELLVREAGTPLTRPQRERALIAIKTAQPGRVIEVGEGVELRFSLSDFIVVNVSGMVL